MADRAARLDYNTGVSTGPGIAATMPKRRHLGNCYPHRDMVRARAFYDGWLGLELIDSEKTVVGLFNGAWRPT